MFKEKGRQLHGALLLGAASRDELLAARKMHAARGSAAAKPTLSPALFASFESAVAGVFARTFARDLARSHQFAQSAFDGAQAERRTEFADISLCEPSDLLCRSASHRLFGGEFGLHERKAVFEVSVRREHRSEQIFDERDGIVLALVPARLRLAECGVIEVFGLCDLGFEGDVSPDRESAPV